MAVSRAAADTTALPLWRYLGGAIGRVLPTPMMNILNGGIHADNGLEIEEFMIIPWAAPTFAEALRAGVEVFSGPESPAKNSSLRLPLATRAASLRASRDESAIAAHSLCDSEAAGYRPGEDIALALDAAMSEFYDEGLSGTRSTATFRSRDELIGTYDTWANKYPIAFDRRRSIRA